MRVGLTPSPLCVRVCVCVCVCVCVLRAGLTPPGAWCVEDEAWYTLAGPFPVLLKDMTVDCV